VTNIDTELGPLLVAPLPYLELRGLIRGALGFPNERKALLIGIDGLDGSGKSSLAAWLSWQLEVPALHLDIYFVPDTSPLAVKKDDLARAVDARLVAGKPVIVEGILLLRVLSEIGRSPDFLIFVDRLQHQGNLEPHTQPYFAKFQPQARSHHVLTWSSAKFDAGVHMAHEREMQ
jgi:hypothetical protein